jgi:D-threo-aldose 1-dehydrogenase
MTRLSEKARVGETKLEITRAGLGGAPIGNLYSSVPETQAYATVERALQVGLSHIDTAPLYGLGLSESRIGGVLRRHSREEYTISTKVGRVLIPSEDPQANGPYWSDLPALKAVFDFSAEGVRKSLQGSRERTGLSRFDIVFIHDCDDYVDQALSETYPVLSRLKESGEVAAIGAGLNSFQTALQLARHQQFDCFLLAGRYTLLEQGAMDEFLPFCQDHGVGVIVGGPFNSGILASELTSGSTYDYGATPPSVLEKARRIKAVCEAHSVRLRSAALQFILANPSVTSVVPGCRSPAEVDSAYEALKQSIPRPFWEELKSRGLLREDAPTP